MSVVSNNQNTSEDFMMTVSLGQQQEQQSQPHQPQNLNCLTTAFWRFIRNYLFVKLEEVFAETSWALKPNRIKKIIDECHAVKFQWHKKSKAKAKSFNIVHDTRNFVVLYFDTYWQPAEVERENFIMLLKKLKIELNELTRDKVIEILTEKLLLQDVKIMLLEERSTNTEVIQKALRAEGTA